MALKVVTVVFIIDDEDEEGTLDVELDRLTADSAVISSWEEIESRDVDD